MTARIDLVRRMLAAGLAASALPRMSSASPPTRVIVIGAGFGGATCAKYIKLSSPKTDVLLVDRRSTFLTGPFTNLVIAGGRNPQRIARNVAAIGHAHGVRTLRAEVTELDPIAMQISTASGRKYHADRIVLSPGIAMRWGLIEGLDADHSDAMPHAWLGDAQVLAMRERLKSVPAGGTIVIGAPSNPYRCPPGPYERASLVAHALKTTGRTRCKIIIADAKDDFSKSALFKLAWDTLYPGMIEWVSRSAGGEVTRVNTASGEVWLRGTAQPVKADLTSMIPAQRAADLAIRADLADESGWCPINADDFESRRHPGVHVIGDACLSAPIPKSAFAANSQAKLCAGAIAAMFNGTARPQPRLLNTCYSLLSTTEAISVSGFYASAEGKLAIVTEGMSPLSGGAELRHREARQAYAWYDNISYDSFGAK
jgi:sulfide dehydrogenase [flavocytochrome c] flavoprotein subunit